MYIKHPNSSQNITQTFESMTKTQNFVFFGPREGGLCLASASPRRLALLRQVGLNPHVQPVDLDETQHPSEPVDMYVVRMAVSKAKASAQLFSDNRERLILGADTVVVVDGRSLGKPATPNVAKLMLARLSGRQHDVTTAVALYHTPTQRCIEQVVTTRVWVKPLSRAEIEAYVATGEPLDKAGAYGIQGVGAFMVERLEGSYSGVVGLPLCETLAMLREFS